MKWLSLQWYLYLIDFSDRQFASWNLKEKLECFMCRIKGHPKGVVFYNMSGFEPDMSCKTCGEDLG
jgi:hypothetical protein